MNAFRLTIISFVLFLTACAGKQLSTITDSQHLERQQQIKIIAQWSVKGRIGIKTAKQGFSANLYWQYQKDKQNFRVYGSLGQTHAELSEVDNKATLVLSDDRHFESTDAERLLHEALGYPLPIKHLEYWIFGIPYPGDDNNLSFDELGYLKTIDYQQWKITYKKYRSYSAFNNLLLPSKITITDGNVTLRLSLRTWTMESDL